MRGKYRGNEILPGHAHKEETLRMTQFITITAGEKGGKKNEEGR